MNERLGSAVVFRFMRGARLGSLVLVFALLAGCATVPFDRALEHSEAISAAEDTLLRTIAERWNGNEVGHSGFYPLIGGNDALGVRLWLMDTAQKSIDAQTFLMKSDLASLVVTKHLLLAADRGVHVRFLLDDAFTTVDDEVLLLADAHPNIEVRLYNPISRRGLGMLNAIGDFRRANRRMHNKSFTVDNQMTIVGGRNIADEYFELRPKYEFLDLDVLAVGPVAQDVSAVFDRFWNHGLSVPMEVVRNKLTELELEAAQQNIRDDVRDRDDAVYRHAINSPVLKNLISGETSLFSAGVEVVTDEPEKLERPVAQENMVLVNHLDNAIRAASSEVLVLTPYLIPGKKGIAFWRSIVEKGVRVVILTNSLASNHHTYMHAGYAKYRKDLLRAGVELYEARANAVPRESSAESVTLHIKGMIMDRRRVFIGSPNFDSRSLQINSEMGLIIDSADMSSQLAEGLMQRLPRLAYRVLLDARGKLQWRGMIDGVETVETSEPLAGRWLKFKSWLSNILSEKQL